MKGVDKKETRNRVLTGVYDSSWGISMITLAVIAALEIFMFIYTFINSSLYGDFIGRYRAFYISLLAIAAIYMLLYRYAKNDMKHRYRLLNVANPIGAALFFAWSLIVTFSDFTVTGLIDTTVFMTFSLMIPLSFYLLPGVYLGIAMVADALMLYLIVTGTGSIGQFINIAIFIVFQLVLGLIFLRLKLILAERIVEEQRNAITDVLTGLSNRRAYENDMEDYAHKPPTGDFTYIAIDINGLKQVNDTRGHKAGDKLIIGAAQCMEQSFGDRAQMYRIGGDEFVVLMPAGQDEWETLLPAFEKRLESWSAENDMTLSVSYGCACFTECSGCGVDSLARKADNRMYESKARHYRENGADRRRRVSNEAAIGAFQTSV